jgi:VWFA-related protein
VCLASIASALALLLPLCLNAQQTPPPAATGAQTQPAPYSIQLNARLVLLDIVVTDQQGNLVTNLNKDDFEVTEDKHPQQIRSLDRPFAQRPAKPVPISSTAELDRLEPNAPVTILVVDELVTSGEVVRFAMEQYLKSQGTQLEQPTMLIAVGGQHFMVLRDYTTNPKELLTALERHYAGSAWIPQLGNDRTRQINLALQSLITVAEATAGHQGHKNMIWIGRGFPEISTNELIDPSDNVMRAVRTCTNLMKESRVTLSTVDPTGVGGGRTGLTGETNGGASYDFHGSAHGDPFAQRINFDALAYATGGQSYYGRNDLDHLIANGVRDGAGFYTLSYRPTTGSDDPKEFRRIDVKVKQPGLHVAFREGYFPGYKPAPQMRTEDGRLTRNFVADITVASRGMIVYDGVPMTIAREGATDKFHIKLQASDLDWFLSEGQAATDTTETADVTLVTESYDLNGRQLSHSAKAMKLHVAPRPGGGTPVGVIDVPAEVKTASAARLRFIVRANSTGRIGADNFFLVDPKTLKDPVTGMAPVKATR